MHCHVVMFWDVMLCCVAASGSLCSGMWCCVVWQQVVPNILRCNAVLFGSKLFPVFWDMTLFCLAASGSPNFGMWYCVLWQQVVPCVLGCDAVLSNSKWFPVFWDTMLCCLTASGSVSWNMMLCYLAARGSQYFGMWSCVVWQQVVPCVLGYDVVSLWKWFPMVWRHHIRGGKKKHTHARAYAPTHAHARAHTHTQNNRPETPQHCFENLKSPTVCLFTLLQPFTWTPMALTMKALWSFQTLVTTHSVTASHPR